MLVTKQLTVATDFHSMEKKILWKSVATVNSLVTNIQSQNSLLTSQNSDLREINSELWDIK